MGPWEPPNKHPGLLAHLSTPRLPRHDFELVSKFGNNVFLWARNHKSPNGCHLDPSRAPLLWCSPIPELKCAILPNIGGSCVCMYQWVDNLCPRACRGRRGQTCLHNPPELVWCPLKSECNSLSAEELLDSYKRFCVLTADDNITRPKTHLMIHMIVRSLLQGNPWRYMVFWDEALNKTLKAVLRNVSQLNFEAMAFFKLEATLQHSAKRARS
jgi:hypothetical protein